MKLFPAWPSQNQNSFVNRSMPLHAVGRGRESSKQTFVMVADQEILFTEIGERLREVSAGPDGALYILTDSMEGRVLRISKQR